MKVYVARQPIFDRDKLLYGYELLYRSSDKNMFSGGADGDGSTRAVLSDAITTFGIDKLINGKYGFVNFTKPLLLEKLPLLVSPKDFVIEILEDVRLDQELLTAIEEYREKDYLLALDDYDGSQEMDGLLPYVDIVKVDFSLVDENERSMIARKLKRLNKKLLAEKVETEEAFMRAVLDGYTLFQGYFFAKPTVFSKSSVQIVSGTAMRVMQELNQPAPSYKALAQLIRKDVTFTYKLLNRVNTLHYYRGNKVESVEQALVKLGMKDLRKWVILTLMKDSISEKSSELVRTALVRGLFAEQLVAQGGLKSRREEAFMTGLFSMIDLVLDDSLAVILENLCISQEVKDALLGEDNVLFRILEFVKDYENGVWDRAFLKLGKTLPDFGKVAELYVCAVKESDASF